MDVLWIVVIVFLFAICGSITFAWSLERHVNRSGAILVVGSRSIYRSEEEAAAFFGSWFKVLDRNRGRLLLIDGGQIVILKRHDVECLSCDERRRVERWRSGGKTICVVRNNDLVRKATLFLQRADAVAAYYRSHPERTTPLERSDKSMFVSGI